MVTKNFQAETYNIPVVIFYMVIIRLLNRLYLNFDNGFDNIIPKRDMGASASLYC
jgi:hypothetical protein